MASADQENERSALTTYDHARWEPRRRVLRFLLRVIGFTLLAKLNHVEGLENVPSTGAAILMINHIAFIDPFVVVHVIPRNIVPLAKIEVYDYPGIGIFPRLWGVIPVRREEVDRRAIQMVQAVLRAGEIVLVAPEGTRGPRLSHGKEGVAYMAARSNALVVPVAIDGTIGFPALRFVSRTWKQPGAVVKFGRPFRYRSGVNYRDRNSLRKMTDEAMFILSSMLPEYRRGVYADLSAATLETIELL